MRNKIGNGILIFGIMLALYVSGWLMIIKPISDCCLAYKAGLLTLAMIGWAALKFLLSATVAWIIVWIASVIRLFVVK